MKFRFFILFALILLGGNTLNHATGQDEPLTVAEKSDFQSTSLSSEVVDFVEWCDKKADHVNKFVFGRTVEGRDMVGVSIANPPYELGTTDDRIIALVIGNIHSGECAGKEGLLMMLRELTHNPDHPWLKNMVILIAPNYNADGNDRIGKGNRPGQVGPANGMGMRENSQHLDLNRDFMKMESPEAQSLIALIDQTNPHLFIDCHTTNGSRHQYALTYDIPHNPAAPKPVRDFLRKKMMPVVTQRLEDEKEIFTFYYGNFNRNQTAWTTYGHEPRYSTEYVGLRGRLSILSEAYAYISYKDRIFASKDFVSACFQYASENAEAIKQLLSEVDREWIETASKQPERIQVSMNAKVGPFEDKFVAKGFKDGKPHDYEVSFVGKYTSTRSVPLPFAYFVPAEHSRVVDRMTMHGIEVEMLENDLEAEVTVDTIQDFTRRAQAFQKHRMITAETERETTTRTIPAGTYVIKTAQPLGRVAACLLEPSSDDGFVFWNFFDDAMVVGNPFPVVSVSEPIQLATSKVTEVHPSGQINFESIDGPNSILANQPATPKWYPGTSQYVMSRWGRDFLVNAETGAFDGMVAANVAPRELATAIQEAMGQLTDDDIVSRVANNRVKSSAKNRFQIYSSDGYQVVYNTVKKSATVLGSPSAPTELFEFTSDEQTLLYVQWNILHQMNLNTGVATPFYDPKLENSEYDHWGKLDWVYQEELYGRGNFKGFWLNPATNEVAVLLLAEDEVQNYTVMDHIPVRGVSEVTAYPKAGDPIPKVSLIRQFVGTEDSQRIELDFSCYADDEILISNVSWAGEGDRLFVQVQNREQTWMDLIATERTAHSSPGENAISCKTEVLFRDQTDAWIESYGTPHVFEDGSFLWISPRSGFTHVYHYNQDGSLRNQLTRGDWEVRSVLGIDSNDKYVYLTATKEDPINVHGYRLAIADGELQKITQGNGTHSLSFSEDMSYFIDTVSTFTTPERSYICRSDGTRLREMETNSDDRLNHLELGDSEFMTIQNANGNPLDAVIIRPPNFDPNKKYPVLYHVYSGPQAPRVRNRFLGKWYLWHQMLAQKGYIVWMCDNRSSSFRGKKGMWETHRDLGKNELADIESSVDWLKKQSWVDGDRIGIWGWSYGGYMTAYAMTHSDSFKMGISGAPVTDWRNYDAIYTERLMGLPQTNPEGYESSSVLNAAKDLHGDLLLIHGTMDDNVHISNTMQFAYELQKAGKQFELMVYPKNRHAVRSEDQIGHLRRLMTEFVLEHL